jgi:hypothetical protein
LLYCLIWLTVEALPGYAPKLNPAENLWGNIKGQELANRCSEDLSEAETALHRGIDRVIESGKLLFSFLRHAGLFFGSTCNYIMRCSIGERSPLDTEMQLLWLSAIEAQLALNKKNPASALNALQAASPVELGQIAFVANISCLYPTYVPGEAHLAAGQGSATATEFQKILDRTAASSGTTGRERWRIWAWLVLTPCRRASQGVDADAARVRNQLAGYKDFLTPWKDADPDIPIVKQAKAEYAKLQ